MDELDVGILREMGRGRVLWWGTMDPRLCAQDIARAVGVDPTTVRARLKRWAADGFLPGYEVLPNPRLFDAVVGGATLRVDDPREKARLTTDLALVDGLIVVHDCVGPWLAVSMVSENEAGFERRRRLLARLPGVDEVLACELYGTGRCEATLTPLDWRIVRALRAHPRDPLTVSAREVGVTAKTFARRYAALVDAGALWLAPLFDFTYYRGGVIVRFIASLDADADHSRFVNRVRDEFPDAVDVRSLLDLGLGLERNVAEIVLHAGSPGLAEAAQRRIWSMDGVDDVELHFPTRFQVHAHWFDDHIRARLESDVRQTPRIRRAH